MLKSELTSSEARMTSMPLEPLDITSFPLFSATHNKRKPTQKCEDNQVQASHANIETTIKGKKPQRHTGLT